MKLRLVRRDPRAFDLQLAFALSFLAYGLYSVWLVAAQPWFLLCPFKRLTGLPCPTCGSGRALRELLALHPLAALAWNPLVTLASVGIGVFVIYAVLTRLLGWKRLRLELDGDRTRLGLGIVVSLLLNWIYLIWRGV